jgi:tetratricopeptide (TPR) repeat protein
MPIQIFISYSCKDEALLNQLKTHLSLLWRQGIVDLCYDRNISAGKEREREIDKYLNAAQIILLLVSPDFMASDYLDGKEIKRAMERHHANEARVIPLILRPVLWRTASFGKLLALPTNAEPVTSSRWYTLDEAFLDIAEGLQKTVEELVTGKSRLLPDSLNPMLSQVIVPVGLPRSAMLVGRDFELIKLMTRLRTGQTSSVSALNGMGGVGKTALAAEAVAQLFQDRKAFPGGAVWIFCEGLAGPRGLSEIWRRIALTMQLEQIIGITDPDIQRIALANTLTQVPRLLLALDNVEPQLDAEVLLNTLTVPGHTALLLTARQAITPEKVTSIMLSPLSILDAVQLFIQRLKQVDENRPVKNDNMWIPQIIAILGGLPLAIELVAAYAGGQRLPLTQILFELEQDKLEAPSLNFDAKRALRSRFKRSWAVLSPQEQRLFAGLALMKGTSFPREIAITLAIAATSDDRKKPPLSRFIDAALAFAATRGNDEAIHKQNEREKMYKQPAELLAKKAVSKLNTYALVEPLANGYMRLHPLLREYAAERLRELPSDIYERLDDATTEFWLEFSRQHPSYIGLTGVEADSVWEARQALWKREIRSRSTSTFLPTPQAHAKELRQLSSYLEEQGELERAQERMLENLTISKGLKDIREMINCYQYLALSYEAEGNYISAIEHYSEALNLLEQIQSPSADGIRARLENAQENIKKLFDTPQDKI